MLAKLLLTSVLMLAFAPFPLTVAGTCPCALIGGPITGDPWTGPAYCEPINATITFGLELNHWGECTAATCTPTACAGKVAVQVSGSAPCRFRVLKNLGQIGGGTLGIGGEFDVFDDFEEACGDFATYSVTYGPYGTVLSSKTYLCEQCTANQ